MAFAASGVRKGQSFPNDLRRQSQDLTTQLMWAVIRRFACVTSPRSLTEADKLICKLAYLDIINQYRLLKGRGSVEQDFSFVIIQI